MSDRFGQILERALEAPHDIPATALAGMLVCDDPGFEAELFAAACEVKLRCGRSEVLPRGLVETSNVCRKNCLYCGIRRDNAAVPRYRLSEADALACVAEARSRGWNAVAFQAGEVESEANTEFFERLLGKVDGASPGGNGCSLTAEGRLGVTLSLGEQTEEVFRRWRVAAGDRILRYLLRIETSDRGLYAKLHPSDHSYDRRLECIRTLKRLGYVTGSGVMIGLPGQTAEDLANDIVFFGREHLDMVGMGPYVPDPATPLAKAGVRRTPSPLSSLSLSLRMIALTRLYLHGVNIVAATALEALDPDGGRERGIAAGANVVMTDLTPAWAKAAYALYPGKTSAR